MALECRDKGKIIGNNGSINSLSICIICCGSCSLHSSSAGVGKTNEVIKGEVIVLITDSNGK